MYNSSMRAKQHVGWSIGFLLAAYAFFLSAHQNQTLIKTLPLILLIPGLMWLFVLFLQYRTSKVISVLFFAYGVWFFELSLLLDAYNAPTRQLDIAIFSAVIATFSITSLLIARRTTIKPRSQWLLSMVLLALMSLLIQNSIEKTYPGLILPFDNALLPLLTVVLGGLPIALCRKLLQGEHHTTLPAMNILPVLWICTWVSFFERQFLFAALGWGLCAFLWRMRKKPLEAGSETAGVPPRVSVVIPGAYKLLRIPRLLESLEAQNYTPYEIILVTSKSKEKLLPLLLALHIPARIITAGPKLFEQRREGGLKATGDIILFIDPDVRIARTFISASVNELRSRKLDVANPLFLAAPEATRLAKTLFRLTSSLTNRIRPFKPIANSSCLLIRSDHYRIIAAQPAASVFDDVNQLHRASLLGRFGQLQSIATISARRYYSQRPMQEHIKQNTIHLLFAFGVGRITKRLKPLWSYSHLKTRKAMT